MRNAALQLWSGREILAFTPVANGSVTIDISGGALRSWRPPARREAHVPDPWILNADADNLPSMSARALSAMLRARHADALPPGTMLAAMPFETTRNASNWTARAAATLASFLALDPNDPDAAARWLSHRGAPIFSPKAPRFWGRDDGGLIVFHSELSRVRQRARRAIKQSRDEGRFCFVTCQK